MAEETGIEKDERCFSTALYFTFFRRVFMNWEQKSIRIGAAVICCAILLRLLGGGGAGRLLRAITSPEAVSVLLFLETGRVVREPTPTTVQTTAPTEATQPPQTLPPATQPPVLSVPVFSDSDASLVKVNNACGYDAQVAARLTQALQWDLTAAAPTVLILHSHGTESYAGSDGYRSQALDQNMVAIGDRLVQVLEAGGVRAVHDRQLHDSPSYSSAYNNSRKSVESYLAQYPSIELVLDIHRDAVEDSDGQQMDFTLEGMAQLMLVVGTDASGLSHPHWPENMSLAVKLHAQLERLKPGICRPISFRSQRFNQDLSPGALIVEVGAAGNTQQQALAAAELLGQAVLELAKGAQGAQS